MKVNEFIPHFVNEFKPIIEFIAIIDTLHDLIQLQFCLGDEVLFLANLQVVVVGYLC